MEENQGFPYVAATFGPSGAPVGEGAGEAVRELVRQASCTDLLVLAHGWNNDLADAERLYGGLLASLRGVMEDVPDARLNGRRVGVLGVFWPSKKFADQALIPGGAASAVEDLRLAEVEAQLRGLRGGFDPDGTDEVLDRLRNLLPHLRDSGSARDAFVAGLRALVPRPQGGREDVAEGFWTLSGREAFARAQSLPALPDPPLARGGAAEVGAATPGDHGRGGALGLLAFLGGGPMNAARNLLNLTTYYQMKARSGQVGTAGLHPLLREVGAACPGLRIHLAGHSFGARLVTSAALGPEGAPPLGVHSLTLLQAAFSHYGFAGQYDGGGEPGFFRRVVSERRVGGPTLVSSSAHDLAVGLAYPVASFLAGEVAQALGGPDDRFGGLGRNGAQKTDEARNGRLHPAGEPYAFEPCGLYNLDGTAFIGGHSDIQGREVAFALQSAVAGG